MSPRAPTRSHRGPSENPPSSLETGHRSMHFAENPAEGSSFHQLPQKERGCRPLLVNRAPLRPHSLASQALFPLPAPPKAKEPAPGRFPMLSWAGLRPTPRQWPESQCECGDCRQPRVPDQQSPALKAELKETKASSFPSCFPTFFRSTRILIMKNNYLDHIL